MKRWVAIALVGVGYCLARVAEWLYPTEPETHVEYFSSKVRRQRAVTEPAAPPAAEPATTPKENR